MHFEPFTYNGLLYHNYRELCEFYPAICSKRAVSTLALISKEKHIRFVAILNDLVKQLLHENNVVVIKVKAVLRALSNVSYINIY